MLTVFLGTLQTKERVHDILERTISRAQNNYRLAAKLEEIIGEYLSIACSSLAPQASLP